MAQLEISLRRPDDWHVHLRDGQALNLTVPQTARSFGRAIIMPNLQPAVTSIAAANAYKERILAARPKGSDFEPLMTLYLTDLTSSDEIERGFDVGAFVAAKLYPAHATTHSSQGVQNIALLDNCFKVMERIGMPLLVHGEVTDPQVDVFDRERVFIERELARICSKFPSLKVVFEHITTKEAVAFVRERQGQVGATITAHHLMINRNAMFSGGIRPHYYCLPVAKREEHRQALRQAAVSGEPWFFLGTDSAPHTIAAKESACGCAGIFSAPCALEAYAQVFDEEGSLRRLENFASVFGPLFYGRNPHESMVTLIREKWQVPARLKSSAGEEFIPFLAGETLAWRQI